MTRFARTLALAAALAACAEPDPPVVTAPVLLDEAPTHAPAGRHIELRVDVTAPDTPLAVTVRRGGGWADDTRSGPDGVAIIRWVLGVAPVDNAIEIALADGSRAAPIALTVRGTLDTPWRAEPFADVHGFLDAEGHTDSTEDLGFGPDGLVLGAPAGLLNVAPDGTITRRPVGEGVNRIWGFAFDADGAVWGVDAGNGRMVRIDPDGAVTEAIADSGGEPLEGPNYVAVDHQGRIYLTDPCRGEIIRLDPASGDTVVHTFDRLTEGGPNGLAVTADGEEMYVATQNTGLLCGQADIPIDAEIAGIHVIDLDDFGGGHRPFAENVALFGDGLAFDAEGNLYAVFDWQENFRIETSAVLVFPAGEREGVPFLVAADRQIFANVAFGTGAYGAETLYIALLAVPGFTDRASRGLERFEVGIPGQPLLPSMPSMASE